MHHMTKSSAKNAPPPRVARKCVIWLRADKKMHHKTKSSAKNAPPPRVARKCVIWLRADKKMHHKAYFLKRKKGSLSMASRTMDRLIFDLPLVRS